MDRLIGEVTAHGDLAEEAISELDRLAAEERQRREAEEAASATLAAENEAKALALLDGAAG